MAELFKATLTAQHGFEKLVVIKKILPHLASDKTFVEMFIDEARITAQLDHRHIVQVFELGTDADTPYIAMQYVDGLDVLALLRECARAQIRLPADLAALIARDCRAPAPPGCPTSGSRARRGPATSPRPARSRASTATWPPSRSRGPRSM